MDEIAELSDFRFYDLDIIIAFFVGVSFFKQVNYK